MNPKIRLIAFSASLILKAIALLSLPLHCLSFPAMGQTAPSTKSGEIYAGIELSSEGATAIALRVSRNEEESGLKLVYLETVRLALGRAGNGQFAPQAVQETAQTVLKLMIRLRQQGQTPPERVFLIGSSGLRDDHPEDLVNAIRKATGKTLVFLDVETEVQLSIVGTISRLGKAGDTQIDNRNSSALIEINNDGVKGGYQLLKHSPSAPPRYDFVAMSIPNDAMSLDSPESLRQALRGERESKPGLVTRKRVYLAGAVVWAVAALVHPENRRPFVPLTYEEIMWFAEKAARAPQQLLNPNLSFIADRDMRQRAESELQAVKNAITPRQLIAGAEALKALASEFEWREKQIWFARFGHLGRLLSYVRMQAEK
ncbi:MAG: hypothetical protein ACREA2_23360 [Blastocatellia bacterium]